MWSCQSESSMSIITDNARRRLTSKFMSQEIRFVSYKVTCMQSRFLIDTSHLRKEENNSWKKGHKRNLRGTCELPDRKFSQILEMLRKCDLSLQVVSNYTYIKYEKMWTELIMV
jgi:hypothetical protein